MGYQVARIGLTRMQCAGRYLLSQSITVRASLSSSVTRATIWLLLVRSSDVIRPSRLHGVLRECLEWGMRSSVCWTDLNRWVTSAEFIVE